MLRRHLGTDEWERRESEFENEKELEAFGEKKASELDMYDEALEKIEERKARVDSGDLTREDFIASSLMESSCVPCSSHVGNGEIRNDEG